MNILLYIVSAVAIFASVMVITRSNAVSALLYMIVSLLSVAVFFFLTGSPFIAALEVIIYAGAIMVLFVFVVMMLNLGEESDKEEKRWLSAKTWIVPSILSAILLAEMIYMFLSSDMPQGKAATIGPKEVGLSLFGPYVIAVELAAFLLISGIVGAYHLGHRKSENQHRYMKGGTE